jgi:hypothetical protein
MTDDQPYNVYRERLSSLYHGYALWEPAPVEDLYERVSIGDVGYVYNGFFYRMFNVTLPWSNLSNQRFGATEPENYEPMKLEEFKYINRSRLAKGDYYSPDVTSQKNINNQFAQGPREYIVLHSCLRKSELTHILFSQCRRRYVSMPRPWGTVVSSSRRLSRRSHAHKGI